jgi:hypothetical protein
METPRPRAPFPGGVFFILLGVGCMVAVTWPVWKNLYLATWKRVPCVVERFEITRNESSDSEFRPTLKFRYELDGRTFTSDRLWLGKAGDPSYETLSNIRESIGPSFPGPAVCRVNRWNPSEAILSPLPIDLYRMVPASLLVGLLIPLGVGVALSDVRRNRGVSRGEAERPAHIAGMVFFGGVGLFGVAGVALPALLRTSAATSWKEVPAQVIWSRVNTVSGAKGDSQRLDLFYRFEFNGRTYHSNSYNFCSPIQNRKTLQQISESHQLGSEIGCYVNPVKPWQAVVDRTSTEGWVFPLFSLGFGAIGCGVILRSLAKSRTPQSGESSDGLGRTS